MAGIYIKVDAADVVAALRRGRDALENARPLFLEIGEELAESTRERFGTQTAPDGTPWAPLSPEYLASKRKRNSRGPNRILTLSGAMGSTISFLATARSTVIGSNQIYAATQQFGRRSGRGSPIPGRPFLGLSASDRTAIIDTALGYLDDAIGG